jgi:MHS family alpha-ketoglutarate permease-like MFS transporter
LIALGAGNALEWFDWNIYATFSIFFATQFFGGDDPGFALLETLAVFAVGFVARPIGGFLFGWLADSRGRRAAMILSVGLVAAGSLVIGLIPTARSIGVLAPISLLVVRLVQGLGQGGELPSAQTYLAELAPRERRGLWSSAIYVSGTLGVLCGTALGAALSGVLSPAQMSSFGWRIPFLLGGLFGLYALVMRARMRETDVFDTLRTATPERAIWRTVLANPVPMLRVVGLTMGGTVSYYVWAVSAPQFAISERGTSASGALWAGSVALACYILVLPLWGWLSDRIGRRPLLGFSVLASAVLFFPLQAVLHGQAWQLLVAMATALVLMGAASALGPAVFAELFPTGIRAAGLGVPYSLAVALFGGTAPYLQTYFSRHHLPAAFTVYAVVLQIITLITVWLMPETRGVDLSDERRFGPLRWG